MKNFTYSYRLLISCFVALFMISCAGGNTPGEKAKAFLQHLADEDFETSLKMIDGFEKAEEEERLKMTALLKKAYKANGKKEGVKDIEILNETINEAGDGASVTLKIVYEDGSEREHISKLVKRDGEWKIAFNK